MMRRRGFTIVEVSTVIFLIILLAATVYPSIGAIQRSQAAIGFRQSVESIAQKARTEAIRQNRATALKFNADGQIGWDFIEDQTEEQIANGADSDELELGAVRDAIQPTPTTEMLTYELNRQDVSRDEWQVGFYPDGSADRAYLEFTQDDQTFLLIVNPQSGSTRIIQGTLSEQAEEVWEAGEIEQRVG